MTCGWKSSSCLAALSVLREVYGPVLDNEQWPNRIHEEMCNLYKEVEFSRNVGLRILHWVGHAIRKKGCPRKD